MLFNIDVKNTA